MAETIEKETLETTEETKETETEVEEEIIDEGGEKKPEEKYTDNEKKLYARIQKLKAKIKETTKEEPKKEVKEEVKKETTQTPIDPIELSKQVKALAPYDDEEIKFAQVLSKGMNVELTEVLKTPEFKTFSDAHQLKIKNDDKVLNPDNKGGSARDKKDPFFEKFSADLPNGFDFTKK